MSISRGVTIPTWHDTIVTGGGSPTVGAIAACPVSDTGNPPSLVLAQGGAAGDVRLHIALGGWTQAPDDFKVVIHRNGMPVAQQESTAALPVVTTSPTEVTWFFTNAGRSTLAWNMATQGYATTLQQATWVVSVQAKKDGCPYPNTATSATLTL